MKKLCVLTGVASVMMLLATAGASDLAMIGLGEVLIKVAFSIAGMFLSIAGIQKCEEKEERQRKRRMASRQNNQRAPQKYRQVA